MICSGKYSVKHGLVAAAFAAMLTSCASSDGSRLDSSDYPDRADRVAALRAEIRSFSEIRDAEFRLFNVNGFSNSRVGVPGSSSADYRFGVRVDTAEIDKWIACAARDSAGHCDTDWIDKVVAYRPKNWNRRSRPECFLRKGEDATIVVYRKEGFVFKRIVNL